MKPSIVPQSLLDHPINHFISAANGKSPQKVVSIPSVTGAKSVPSAILTADAANTAKALTNAGDVHLVSGAAVNAPAIKNALQSTLPNPVTTSNASGAASSATNANDTLASAIQSPGILHIRRLAYIRLIALGTLIVIRMIMSTFSIESCRVCPAIFIIFALLRIHCDFF